MVEQMLRDVCTADPKWSITILRYLNVVGAHSSGDLDENPVLLNSTIPPRDQGSAFPLTTNVVYNAFCYRAAFLPQGIVVQVEGNRTRIARCMFPYIPARASLVALRAKNAFSRLRTRIGLTVFGNPRFRVKKGPFQISP